MFLPSTPCFTETVKESVPAMEVRSLTTESKGSCHRGEFIVAVGGTLDAGIVTGSLDFDPPPPSSPWPGIENTALRFPPRGGI